MNKKEIILGAAHGRNLVGITAQTFFARLRMDVERCCLL